jgi:hypothetical protein
MLEQLEAVEDGAGSAHEGLQQRELLRRQADVRLAAPGALGGGIEAQVAEPQHGGSLHRAAARKRPQAGGGELGASWPLMATSAAMPSSRSPRRIRLAIFTSSSTIRTLIALILRHTDESTMSASAPRHSGRVPRRLE